jgi:rhodanese-related sulfurtransferase
MEVARFLTTQGFDDVANLDGGILKWSRDLDPSIPQY